ncbi:MAG: flagellar basal body-associated FliL family protein [Planctomycetes bacterium]|nr:flagellar basal body-associated FliL family protein [Planctomycetota bacterium]
MADIDTEMSDDSTHGSSLKGKIMLAGAIGVVILFECMLAYFLLPSAEDIAKAAQPDPVDTKTVSDEVSEVELGEFHITDHKIEANSTWNIQFMLWAVVATSEVAEFDALLKSNRNRLRDRIIAVMRNSDASDLSDAELGLIRRRILETTNALFGKRLVREISFSNYRFRID